MLAESQTNVNPPHKAAIAKFIKRINAAVTRSPLLKVSSRTTSRQIDLVRFSCLGTPMPRTLVDGAAFGESVHLQFDASPDEFGRVIRDTGEDELFGGNRRKKDQLTLLSQLEQMRRAADLARRETGVHALWVGFPLVYAPAPQDSDASSLLAPIFLFPTELVPSKTRQGRVTVQRNKDLPPKFNTAMSAWVQRMLGIEIEQPSADDLHDLSIRWLDRYIEHLGEQFVPAARWPGLNTIREVPDSEQLQGSGVAQLFAAGLLGLFRWQNESILADLESISKIVSLPAAADGLLRGTKRSEPVVVPPPEVDRYFVTDADFSQQRVVWKSRTGTGIVVHGPPGTGKSQTIVNIIADAVARGESVLMVCQKEAATSVVMSRLKAAGLADLCVEMHDPETEREKVFKEIRNQVQDNTPTPHDRRKYREGLSAEIERVERDLDEFAAAIRKTHPRCGVSFQQLLGIEGRLMSAFPTTRPLPLIREAGAKIDNDQLAGALSEIERAGAAFYESSYLENPWRFRQRGLIMTPTVESDMVAQFRQLATSDRQHSEAWSQKCLFEFPVDVSSVRTHASALQEQLKRLDTQSADARGLISAWLDWLRRSPEAVESASKRVSEAVTLAKQAADNPPDPAWRDAMKPLAEAEQRLLRESAKTVSHYAQRWWRVAVSDYRAARAVLKRHRPDAIGPAVFTIAAGCEPYFAAVELQTKVLAAARGVHPSISAEPSDASTAIKHIQAVADALNHASSLHKLIVAAPWTRPLLTTCLRAASPKAIFTPVLSEITKRFEHVARLIKQIDQMAPWFQPDAITELKQQVCKGSSIAAWLSSAESCLPRLDALRTLESAQQSPTPVVATAVKDLLRYEADARKGDVHPTHAKPESAAAHGKWWRALAGVSVADYWRQELWSANPVLERLSTRDQDGLVNDLQRLLAQKRNIEAEFIRLRWCGEQQKVKHEPWDVYFKLRGGRNGPAKKMREAVGLTVKSGLL